MNSNRSEKDPIIERTVELMNSLDNYVAESNKKIDDVAEAKHTKQNPKSFFDLGLDYLQKKTTSFFADKGISLNVDLTREKVILASTLKGNLQECISEIFPNNKTANECAAVLTIHLLNAKQQNTKSVVESKKSQGKFGGSEGALGDLIDRELTFLETNYHDGFKLGSGIFSQSLKEEETRRPTPMGTHEGD